MTQNTTPTLDDNLKQIVMRFGWITEHDDWQQAVTDIKQALYTALVEQMPEQLQNTKKMIDPAYVKGWNFYREASLAVLSSVLGKE